MYLLRKRKVNLHLPVDCQNEIVRQDPFRVVLGRAYRGLTGGFLLLRNFSVTISVSPHVCFILV